MGHEAERGVPSSIRARPGRLAPLAAAAFTACTGSVSTPSAYIAHYVEASCRWQAHCGAIGASEIGACIETTDLVWQPGYDVDGAVRAHRLGYDEGSARACLEALGAAPCHPDQGALAACDAVFVPNSGPGATCFGPLECTSGQCHTSETGCAGTCPDAPDPVLGCLPTCPRGGFCDGTTCQPRASAGAACQGLGQDRCGSGLACRGEHCGAQPAEGEPCEDVCAPGLYCDLTAVTSTVPPLIGACHPAISSDGLCQQRNACQDGLACVGLAIFQSVPGRCTPILDRGSQCDASLDSEASGCPTDLPCSRNTLTCTSVDLDTGAPCGLDPVTNCRYGLYCDARSARCTAYLPLGSGCATPPGCMPGTVCDGPPCWPGMRCDPATKACVLACD
jgi:hypothetical protein